MSAREIHVVIAGVSVAGIKVAKTVAALSKAGYPNLRITLVDRNAYTYHALGAPRGIVDQEFGQKLILPLANLLSAESPKHQFIQASLTSVTTNNTVYLSTGQSLTYDFLVLATGSRNNRPAHLTASSIDGARAEARRLFENVAAATSVLIVGGGAVGVEMAGEIAGAYPNKKVTLVHSGSRLLPLNFKPAISDGVVAKLQRLGVTVVLNEKVAIPSNTIFDSSVRPLTLVGASGHEYASDLQILATGTHLETDFMIPLETALNASLRDTRGAIKVNSHLQLDTADRTYSNIYVPGDVNNLPMGAKYAMKAAEQGANVGNNIVALIKNPQATGALKPWDGSLMDLILVPIGKQMGVFQGMGMTLGKSWFGDVMARNMKGKDYFLSQKLKDFPPGTGNVSV
ncbi:hypothetical protein IWW38_005672 [Coemansia aciculifera]|uniref:Uncharacterized protein n=1 Tax=Coemansia aciculifera TaxID=417176 RepID=A0ACC1LUF5_9FUNG|nr:hypothetical protein IWW38_005672 [Coemansia aciculifera]